MAFSDDVIVDESGSPRLLLETGTDDSAATFYTGNETSVLTFRSTIQVGSFFFVAVGAQTVQSCDRGRCESMQATSTSSPATEQTLKINI